MPIYDYQCPAGHNSERFTSVADRNTPNLCPECHEPAERIPSAPATPVLNPARPVRRPKNM